METAPIVVPLRQELLQPGVVRNAPQWAPERLRRQGVKIRELAFECPQRKVSCEPDMLDALLMSGASADLGMLVSIGPYVIIGFTCLAERDSLPA